MRYVKIVSWLALFILASAYGAAYCSPPPCWEFDDVTGELVKRTQVAVTLTPHTATGGPNEPNFGGVFWPNGDGTYYSVQMLNPLTGAPFLYEEMYPYFGEVDVSGIMGLEGYDQIFLDGEGNQYIVSEVDGQKMLTALEGEDAETLRKGMDAGLKEKEKTDGETAAEEEEKAIKAEKKRIYEGWGDSIMAGLMAGRSFASAFTTIAGWFGAEQDVVWQAASDFGKDLADLSGTAAVEWGWCTEPSVNAPSALAFGPDGSPAAHIEGYVINMNGRIIDCTVDEACTYFDPNGNLGLLCGEEGVCMNPDGTIYKSDQDELYHIITFQIDPAGMLKENKEEVKFKLVFDGTDSQAIDVNGDEPGGVEITLARSTGAWGASAQHPLIRRTLSTNYQEICIHFLDDPETTYNRIFWSSLEDATEGSGILCNHLYEKHDQASDPEGWWGITTLGFAGGGWQGDGSTGGGGSSSSGGGETVEGMPNIIN